MITDIWNSFRAMPLWVQIWVALLLVPINMASLFFWSEPFGIWIAVLAVGAMAMNLPIMIFERGFSKMMALPHLIPWSGLVLWLLICRPVGSEAFAIYLWILLVTDAISLGFDFPDAWKWWKGDREVAS